MSEWDQRGRHRAQWAASLRQAAQIERPTETADGYGGVAETWEVIAAAAPCKVQALRQAREAPAGAEVRSVVLFDIGLLWDADVSERDRLTVDGARYEALGVYPLTYATGLVARCVRAEEGAA